MRFRVPEIILGVLIATCFWSVILVWQQNHASDDRQPAKTEAQHSTSGPSWRILVSHEQQTKAHEKEEWYDTFLEHTPDWFVAIFTGILTFVTWRLVKSTNKLWEAADRDSKETRDFNRKQINALEFQGIQLQATADNSEETAKMAAKQAAASLQQVQLTAESFKRLERPYVWPTELSPILAAAGEELGYYHGPHITIKLGNFGRTPAILHNIDERFSGSLKSGEPEAGSTERANLNVGNVIRPGKVFNNILFAVPKLLVESHGRWFAPPKRKSLYLVLAIRYEDPAGIVRKNISTWIYDHAANRFVRHGGKEHNYEEEIAS